VGRFAPSPTGPLHLGSLLTAVASYLDARADDGAWHLRIDDLDRPRNAPGAADEILHILDAHGLHWDGPVTYQSRHGERYVAALEALARDGCTFQCTCSRSRLRGHRVYPGTCRDGRVETGRAGAIRLRVGDIRIEFDDRIQGFYGQDLASDVGDFVVRRRDGLCAYPLAVVVDDATLGVTHVVRGADLLDNSPRQILLQRALALREPAYAHVPVVVDRRGDKLSKQTGARGIAASDSGANLCRVLSLLGQNPGAELAKEAPAAILKWAKQNWRPCAIPRAMRITGAPL
jgi:glutamyl-Q tRNA(Asp) synthetase